MSGLSNFGTCERCWRVVWVSWVLGQDVAGNPYGLCSSCAPTTPEKPSPAASPRLSLVPSPPA